MRNFIIMICVIIFGGLLIGNLAACSAPPVEEETMPLEERREISSAEKGILSAEEKIPSVEKGTSSAEEGILSAEEGIPTAEEGTSSAKEGTSSAEEEIPTAEEGTSIAEEKISSVKEAWILSEEAADAYAALLREILDTQTLPDGTLLDCAGLEMLNWNDFALYDLNGDGVGELVLNWVNSSHTGQMEVVFTYDSAAGEVRELLRSASGTDFYGDGGEVLTLDFLALTEENIAAALD